jgi:hypothetical protein
VCTAGDRFKLMKVQLFKYTTTEEFNERIQSVLNVGQEPVLNMKIQKIFYSKTSEAFKKIQSSQEKGSIHAPDQSDIIKTQDVDWKKKLSGNGHAVVIGIGSMAGNSVLHIKDSNFDSPWFVESIDVMVQPHPDKVLLECSVTTY